MDKHNEIEEYMPEWTLLIKRLYEEARKEQMEKLRRSLDNQ
jgi:hypothetical protein